MEMKEFGKNCETKFGTIRSQISKLFSHQNESRKKAEKLIEESESLIEKDAALMGDKLSDMKNGVVQATANNEAVNLENQANLRNLLTVILRILLYILI